MDKTRRKARQWTAVVLSLPLLAGCAGTGWEDILAGVPTGDDVRGEIAWVDQRNREIGVRGAWSGRETVRYDSRTRVIYRRRNHRVGDLERGDLVRIDVDSDSRGRRYARTVRVERSVRDSDRRGSETLSRRFEGRVLWVDHDRGLFGVEMGQYDYTVALSYRSNRETVRRFERLRRGDRVRFEGAQLNSGRVELYRFL